MTHTEKTAAETKSIGFDYQYYFFLWKLFSLRNDESIGLEVKDDVHIELANNKQILYQIKHTVQQNKDGSPKNLTELDTDLWKTLYNWVKVITDIEDDRESIDKQLFFLKNTTFIIASNKSSSSSNNILSAIDNFEISGQLVGTIRNTFLSLDTTNEIVKTYIEEVLKLDDRVLCAFIENISFELGENDIIKKCKEAIKADKIPEHKIDGVFSNIDSAIRHDNFLNIKKGQKVIISFNDFYLKYRKYYDVARNQSLIIKEFSDDLPNKIEDQIFIKQILEIGDIQPNDIELIAEFTRFRLKLKNNLDRWLQEGELTSIEIANFKNNALLKWKHEFRKKYRKPLTDDEHTNSALDILDNLRVEQLQLDGQILDVDMSNGHFYELSNIPIIGWKQDWGKYQDDNK